MAVGAVWSERVSRPGNPNPQEDTGKIAEISENVRGQILKFRPDFGPFEEIFPRLITGNLCEQIEITRVGDRSAPGIIAAAVMAGHRYARETGTTELEVPLRRDEPTIMPDE